MMPNKSLGASGGSVFLNLLGAAKGALIRAAASTQPFGRFAIPLRKENFSMRKILIPAAFLIVAVLSAVAQETLTVMLIDGDRRSTLRYTTPDAKGRVGGVGIFTVVKGYASLDGMRADTRSRTDTPQLEFSLNSAANPKNQLRLVKFD